MFPYHYYMLLKFAVYKFRILFLHHDHEEKAAELDKKNTFGLNLGVSELRDFDGDIQNDEELSCVINSWKVKVTWRQIKTQGSD